MRPYLDFLWPIGIQLFRGLFRATSLSPGGVPFTVVNSSEESAPLRIEDESSVGLPVVELSSPWPTGGFLELVPPWYLTVMIFFGNSIKIHQDTMECYGQPTTTNDETTQTITILVGIQWRSNIILLAKWPKCVCRLIFWGGVRFTFNQSIVGLSSGGFKNGRPKKCCWWTSNKLCESYTVIVISVCLGVAKQHVQPTRLRRVEPGEEASGPCDLPSALECSPGTLRSGSHQADHL